MPVDVLVGDLLTVPTDVLISTANPWLQMTGGVNLQIFLRPGGEQIEAELRQHLLTIGRRYVEPGTVVRTEPGPLPVQHLLHAVAIGPTYDSSPKLVASTLARALETARELGARTVSGPALATGYGPLSMEQFGLGLAEAVRRDWSPLAEPRVVLRRDADAAAVRAVLAR